MSIDRSKKSGAGMTAVLDLWLLILGKLIEDGKENKNEIISI